MKRVQKADIIVLYKEFPHTDVVERAEDVLDLVLATLRGEVRPANGTSGGIVFVVICRTVSGDRIRTPSSSPPFSSIWQKRR